MELTVVFPWSDGIRRAIKAKRGKVEENWRREVGEKSSPARAEDQGGIRENIPFRVMNSREWDYKSLF